MSKYALIFCLKNFQRFQFKQIAPDSVVLKINTIIPDSKVTFHSMFKMFPLLSSEFCTSRYIQTTRTSPYELTVFFCPQTCIQESMMPTGPSMLMMVAANRSGPLSRPTREIHQYEGSDINALPGPGVYWDKNFLIRLKGDPGISGSRSEQKHTASLESNGEANEGGNTLTDHDAQFSAIYDDHEDRALFSKAFQLKSNKHYSETGEEISAYSNSFFRKQLGISGNELTQQKDISLSNSGYPSYDTNLTSTVTDPDDTKYYQENNNYEFNTDSRPSWDSYDEYDSTQYTSSVVTDEPSDEGHKSDKYELDLYHIMNLGNYTWRTVTSVYKQLGSSHLGNYAWRAVTSVYNQLRSSFSVVQCYELVVCEAHRVGRAWGDSGMLLASGLR